jgi:hypothetical protein
MFAAAQTGMGGAGGHRAVQPRSLPEHSNHVSEMQQKGAALPIAQPFLRVRDRRMLAGCYFTSNIFRVSWKFPACTR